MTRLSEALLLTALTIGATSGCSDDAPTTEQNGQIIHFAQGVDAQILEDQWVQYYDQPEVPGGVVRNVNTDRRFTGCVAVKDEFFSLNLDDGDCFWQGCNSADDQHCKAQYMPEFDYERLEERVVRDCPAFLTTVKREFKSPEVAEDLECVASLGPGQRLARWGRFVLWFKTPNPEYDAEEKDELRPEPAYLVSRFEITADQWATVQRSDPVTVRIREGEIVGASLV